MKIAKPLFIGFALLFAVGCGTWAPVVPADGTIIGEDGSTNSVEYVVNPNYAGPLKTVSEINRLIPSPLQGLIELALSAVTGGLAVWAKLKSGQKKQVRQMIAVVAAKGDDKVKTELAKQLAVAGLVPQFKEEIKSLVT